MKAKKYNNNDNNNDNNIDNSQKRIPQNDFDTSLIKNVKNADLFLIHPVNLIGFFSCMNFSNLNTFTIVNEKLEVLNTLTFMSYTSYNPLSYGKIKNNLAMSEEDYKKFLTELGFKKVLRWQININENGYADVIVCIDNE